MSHNGKKPSHRWKRDDGCRALGESQMIVSCCPERTSSKTTRPIPPYLKRLGLGCILSLFVLIHFSLLGRVSNFSDVPMERHDVTTGSTVTRNPWEGIKAPFNDTKARHTYNMSYGNARNPKSLGNLSILSLAPRSFRSNAIVYLVQKRHSTYRRDSYELLIQSLRLLRDNYLLQDSPNHLENTDLFLFHTGDFDWEDVIFLEGLLLESIDYPLGLVKLVNLQNTPYWRLPHNLKNDNISTWHVADLFPIGYRHMCRFFAITIWDFFKDLGSHEYILRLDEDAFLLSPIPYNIFDWMKEKGYNYGYRLCSYELTHHKFLPHWWQRWHSQIQHKAQRWPLDWNLCGFYNNFFVASVPFFQSKPVQAFLKNEIDQRGFIYRHRYGDLIVHSLAVYAFSPPKGIHRFLDFTYQHMTFVDGDGPCPLLWGAIQAGYADEKANETLTTFYQQHDIDRCLQECQIKQKDDCRIHVNSLTREDLSPTYSHLPDHVLPISLSTIAAGKVELLGMGNLSG